MRADTVLAKVSKTAAQGAPWPFPLLSITTLRNSEVEVGWAEKPSIFVKHHAGLFSPAYFRASNIS